MNKKLIVDTSTGGLDYYPFNHDIEVLRIKIFLDEKEYLDGSELKAEEFYKILREQPELIPKTSQPSVGDVISFFEDLYEKGYDEFYVTTLSSKLSGTHNSIVLASKELKDKMNIHVFDTLTVCFSEGLFALEADKMLKSGKSFEQIDEVLLQMREHNTIFFAVDSLSYLVKNGRLSNAQAFVGKLLKIKPILQVQETGHIVSIEKIRNIKKALESITAKIKAYANGREFEAYILYTGNPKLKAHFIEIIKTELGLENLYESPSTPVVGAHIGPDVCGIGIFLK
ncbi:DegV family protein [Mariniplasma anaerobium]|uniref:Protein DegV n=1 Tax=Mariniplasma anaerobium TaxID=2735436 RepID=A0A7U9XWK6_9MOLU|nr:DegV family protein [Mariniplasma anaerobium]BCR35453.1 protein DegV [Mariniplasma anaerobium]